MDVSNIQNSDEYLKGAPDHNTSEKDSQIVLFLGLVPEHKTDGQLPETSRFLISYKRYCFSRA
ncbi:MAG: hypothetical protein PVJ05_08150 [Candidatus Thorarchaeota archaeon]